MVKRMFRFFRILWYLLFKKDYLFLYLLEDKAHSCLDDCLSLNIPNTEQLEDLIFHIRSYYEIPKVVRELKFPDMQDFNVKSLLKKKASDVPKEITEYLVEIEVQRAVERDIIFDLAKNLPFGFTI